MQLFQPWGDLLESFPQQNVSTQGSGLNSRNKRVLCCSVGEGRTSAAELHLKHWSSEVTAQMDLSINKPVIPLNCVGPPSSHNNIRDLVMASVSQSVSSLPFAERTHTPSHSERRWVGAVVSVWSRPFLSKPVSMFTTSETGWRKTFLLVKKRGTKNPPWEWITGKLVFDVSELVTLNVLWCVRLQRFSLLSVSLSRAEHLLFCLCPADTPGLFCHFVKYNYFVETPTGNSELGKDAFKCTWTTWNFWGEQTVQTIHEIYCISRLSVKV